MLAWMSRTLLLLAVLLSTHVEADTLHRGLGPAPDTLDPHAAQGLSAFNLLRDLHEGLLTRDPAGRPIPAIARSWQVSEDGRTWRFVLDPAARWSDGTRIVAADFVRGFERAADPATASPTAGWLDVVDSAHAIGEDRLLIRLARRVPWFEELLTLPVAYPWPEGRDLYSGAFGMERRVPGARFELAPNPHFREAESVRLSKVVWHVTEDPSAELARFRAGELHITESVPPGRHDWLVRQFGDAFRVAPYLGSFYLAFNLSRAPFADDARLREALSLAIDRELIAERVLGAGQLPAWRLVPPGLSGWPQRGHEHAGLGTEERIRRAQALLAESGFDRRHRVELRFNSSLAHRRLASAVASM